MRKILLWLICLLLFACATDKHTGVAPREITFETGVSRKAAMNAITDVIMDDGFTIDRVNEKDGTITCKPRVMLYGVLRAKTDKHPPVLQRKSDTYNNEVQFSAKVSREGIVTLKTLVSVPGFGKPFDRDRSKKLAGYYEKRIMQRIKQKIRRKKIKIL